jgi:predicted lipoprotein with Yx(FWY)xxD motif
MRALSVKSGLHVAFGSALTLLLAGCAGASVAPTQLGQTQGTRVGEVLAGPDGMTLYTYDEDTRGTSNCTGLCAAAWPPLHAPADAESFNGFTPITRPDGSKQWAYDGEPLYLYVGDSKPGDVRGDGVDEVWHVARP